MKRAIGIDFGTTKTLVSWFSPQTNQVELIRLGQRGTDKIPTSIYYDEHEGFLFAEDADDQMAFTAERYKKDFKLDLGSRTPSLFIDKNTKFKAVELTCEFLKYVKARCEEEVFMGESISDAVITMPVAFSPAQQKELKQAALDAGFLNVTLLPEPEAAGRAFAHNNPTDNFKSMMIVDWGGGTVDFAMVSRNNDEIHVNADSFDGDDQYGGVFFDDLLWGYVADKIAKNDPQKRNPCDEPQEIINTMLKEVRSSKERLSKTSVSKIMFSGSTGPYSTSVTQDEFIEVIKESVEEIGDKLNALLQKIRRRGGAFPEALLMIGGSSSIPLVRQILTEKSGLKCISWQYSHEAVAIGAALVAGEATPATSSQTEPASSHTQKSSLSASQAPVSEVPSYDDIVEEPQKLQLVKTLAEKGNAEAQYVLGLIYYIGHKNSLAEENPELSFSWFLKAAEQGHVEAEYEVAESYFYGYGTPKDYGKVFSILSADKFQENAAALEILGKMYSNGLFINQDISKAAEYLEKAVAYNNDEAMVELALIYDGRVEFKKVENLLLSAIQLENARAMKLLGTHYITSDNKDEGVDLLKRAVDLKEVSAMVSLGMFYCRNDKLEEGMKLLSEATQYNEPEAFYCLGLINLEQKNRTQGIKCLEEAANLGHTEALVQLGHCYNGEFGIKEQPAKSLKYFQLAAEQGNAEGICYVGVHYLGKDDSNAEKYLEEAASKGHSLAARLLLQYFLKTYSEREKDLLKAMERIVFQKKNLSDFYLMGDIPGNKLINAWESYGSKKINEDSIIALYDSTVFGGAKDGFILTYFGIAWHNFCEEPRSVLWSQIDKITYDTGTVYINGADINVNDSDEKNIAQMILNLRNCYETFFENYGQYNSVDEIFNAFPREKVTPQR